MDRTGEVRVGQEQGGTQPTPLAFLTVYYMLGRVFVGIRVYIGI